MAGGWRFSLVFAVTYRKDDIPFFVDSGMKVRTEPSTFKNLKTCRRRHCEESKLKSRSTEFISSKLFYARIPPRTDISRSDAAAVLLHHTWLSRLSTCGSQGSTAAAL